MSTARVMTAPTVRCDRCAQVWLAPGLRPGEKYACKGCGQLISAGGREAAGKTGDDMLTERGALRREAACKTG